MSSQRDEDEVECSERQDLRRRNRKKEQHKGLTEDLRRPAKTQRETSARKGKELKCKQLLPSRRRHAESSRVKPRTQERKKKGIDAHHVGTCEHDFGVANSLQPRRTGKTRGRGLPQTRPLAPLPLSSCRARRKWKGKRGGTPDPSWHSESAETDTTRRHPVRAQSGEAGRSGEPETTPKRLHSHVTQQRVWKPEMNVSSTDEIPSHADEQTGSSHRASAHHHKSRRKSCPIVARTRCARTSKPQGAREQEQQHI